MKPTKQIFFVGDTAAPMDQYEGPDKLGPLVKAVRWNEDHWELQFALNEGGVWECDEGELGCPKTEFWFHEDECELIYAGYRSAP